LRRSQIDSMQRATAEILIVGAGPSGAAAAHVLAAHGRDVLLVDRSTFPRDKVCGDALIPDALNALRCLGLDQRVSAESRPSSSVRVYAPHGRYVSADVDVGCIPRRRLDDLLLQAALASGARIAPPYALAQALEHQGRVVGATFASCDGADALTVHAHFTLLATGAAVRPLELFSVAQRRSPSALAARVYVRVPRDVASKSQHFSISIDRAISPGYGWIFPGPDDVFNVGVGYFTDTTRSPPSTNLRTLLARFLASFAPARDLMSRACSVSTVRGAPLRTALTGAALARPGLLVIGEAAGLTYPFTGEGIGKAMESGIVAGEILARCTDASQSGRDEAARRYAAAIRARFDARFRAYRLAQRWLSRPALSDFLAWRGTAGTYVGEQLRSLLLETADPRALFSLGGVLRALVK
jgi:geranylgeranyl reductase family protein